MREKKSGALSRMQKLRKRLSHSFGRLCKCKLISSWASSFQATSISC
nr:unnamed protein product [Callosobruchus chinensis]